MNFYKTILCFSFCFVIKGTMLMAEDLKERGVSQNLHRLSPIALGSEQKDDNKLKKDTQTVSQTNNEDDNKLEKDTQVRKQGRRVLKLWIGRTESEDQMIVTGTAFSLASFGLAKACKSLSPLTLAGGFVSSYLLADLASGILHMTLDNIDVNTCPNSLKQLAIDFQDHHKYPWRMKIDSFWFQNNELYAGLAYGFASMLGLQALGYEFMPYLLISTGLWSMVPQIAHAAAHGKFSNNKLISFLQNYGVILSQKHHQKHHRNNFSENFCILSGYMEPIASRIYLVAKYSIGMLTNPRKTTLTISAE